MKFSIIMASYNQEAFVKQAIESVLNQTYQDFELIIVDGLSTDNSFNIIKDYKNNNKIKILHEKDSGLYHARNKGLLMASGDVVSFLNTDDFYETDTLENIAKVFKKNSCDIIYGITKAINKENKWLWNLGQTFDKQKFISHFITIPDPSTFLKRHNLSLIGLYDTTLKFGGDGDYWQRCIKLNLNFYFLNKVITNYRVYDETLTYNPKLKKKRLSETKQVHRRYYRAFLSPYLVRLYFYNYIRLPFSKIKLFKIIYSLFK